MTDVIPPHLRPLLEEPNYAYLGTANASGQWSARDFRRRLTEVAS